MREEQCFIVETIARTYATAALLGSSLADIDDITQEVMLDLFPRELPKKPGELERFVRCVTKSKVINLMRRQGTEYGAVDIELAGDLADADTETALAELLGQEEEEEVMAALREAASTPVLKRVLKFVLDGSSGRDVARRLEVSPDTGCRMVRLLVAQAKVRLELRGIA